MLFTEFKNYATENIINYLTPDFEGAEMTISTIRKANGYNYEALSIGKKGEKCSVIPALDLTRAYEKYQQGEDLEDILSELADIRMNAKLNNFDKNSILTFEGIKDKILPRLVNTSINAEYLSNKGELKSFYGATIAGAILAGAGLFLTTSGLLLTLLRKQLNGSAVVFFIVMYVLFTIIGLFSVLVLSTRKRIRNRPDNDNRIDCDKDGVIFITSQGERKTYWDNYQAIRAFKYTMAFIPKDRKGMYLLVPIENLQNVTSFLEENDINIEVIR